MALHFFPSIPSGRTARKNIYRLPQNVPGPFLQLAVVHVSNRVFDYNDRELRISLRFGQCLYGVSKDGGDHKRGRDALLFQLDTVEQTARAAGPSVAQRGNGDMGFADVFTQLFQSRGSGKGWFLAQSDHIPNAALGFQ